MAIRGYIKNTPSWLCGGLMAAAFSLLYYFLFLQVLVRQFSDSAEPLGAPLASPFIISSVLFTGWRYEVLGFVILSLQYFVVGAAIGWVFCRHRKQ